jgi:carboxyl-terminal processing protease
MRKYTILAVFLFAVFSIGNAQEAPDNFEISKNIEILTRVYQELNSNYVDDVQSGELMKTGIDAMLKSLDPYTVYIPESQIEDYKFITTGQYGGVGALIHTKGDYVYVSEPYEGFAAERAGLKAGDKILEVNGEDAKGKNSDDLSKILKGTPGTEISIKVERKGTDQPLVFNLKRETIKVRNVSYYGMLDAKTGYIKLDHFTQKAFEEVRDAFLDMKNNRGMESLVFDLRGNGGGLMNEAVDIVGLFVPQGTKVVETRAKLKARNQSYQTSNKPLDTKIPIVFLVDNNSASASEIVAGAMQDLDRAVVIGQPTFGKGLVQNVVPLNYNAQMKITIAKYYIPSGRCIQAIDYTHKNGKKAEKIPDSLRQEFKTKGGRSVMDGKGIKPDLVIEPQEFSNIAASLFGGYHIFDFSTDYYYNHNEIPAPADFVLSDDDMEDFRNFTQTRDVDYKTRSEALLDKLESALESEEYKNLVEEELASLHNSVLEHKKQDFNRHLDEIEKLLRLEIIARYYLQEGRIEASLDSDPEVQEALRILSDYPLYSDILAGKFVPDNKND